MDSSFVRTVLKVVVWWRIVAKVATGKPSSSNREDTVGKHRSRAQRAGKQEKQLIPFFRRIIQLITTTNFKFVSVDDAEESLLHATRDAADKWETFFMTENVDGTISLRSIANGKYVSAQHSPGGAQLIGKPSQLLTAY